VTPPSQADGPDARRAHASRRVITRAQRVTGVKLFVWNMIDHSGTGYCMFPMF
jgi:hypothetical protein